MARCSGFPSCDSCKKLGLNCVPIPGKTRPEHVDARQKRGDMGTEDKVESLEGMMNSLELEGWHFVSREEVEEYKLDNGSS
jgi:hypothetical protein